ncbi:MAG TPA: DUF4340 domain-containing protein [Chthoniobacteraceae bacterium]|jgi:hypothetical protein|nr:DUF4340 domain-containing protein [Chthoniobacteraceae bacterium]
MKLRNTLILLVIAGAIFCFLRFYETKQPTTQEAQELSSHVVQMDRDKIDGLNITNNDTRIELRKRNDQWQMDAPVKDRADEAAVTQLLTSIDTLDKDTTIKPEDLREYGVVKPSVTLQLLGQDAPGEILFGKDAAIEGKEYIRLGNSNEVYVVSNELRTQVIKPADDFRSHQLATIAASQVTDVDIKTAAGEIELKKNQDHWQIEKPIKARGDDAKISDIISQTLTTKIDSFVPDAQAGAANTALNDAAGTVTFTAEGVEKPLVLQLSKPIEKDPQKVYAKVSDRDAVFFLPKTAAAILDTKPNDVRDHHLVRLDFNTVDRIHIAAAGAPEILLARKGENWTIKSLNDKPANAGDVQKMVTALQDQLVTAFVSDVATDLAKYGLDQPQVKVTFSSYASENTAETKAGEEPLESILFGKVDGNNVYAKLDDEPFIVTVPASILDNIYTDPLKWQDLAIDNLKPDDITALDVTHDNQATISLVKEKGLWKPAKGDIALNTPNIEGLVNTLATLRAEQWAGVAKPEQGLDKPAVTIAFTTADKKTNTVKIGAPAGNYWYASAGGHDGTFEISKTDHDALSADVLPAASPAPTQAIPAASPEPGATATPEAAPSAPPQVSTSPVQAK